MFTVELKTSIDCCKKFVRNIPCYDSSYFNPVEGDYITVYEDSAIVIDMKVCGKCYVPSTRKIIIYLNSPNNMNITDFEKFLKSKGFSLN